MLNFARFFFQGLKNTLRLQNGINFSYKGPWVPVIGETVIDEWYVGDFMAAEYTVVLDVNNGNKEIIKALVVAGPEVASLTVFGRTNTNTNLLELSATVNASKVSVIASPAFSVDGSTQDNSSLLQGGKLIFSANYYHTQNDLTPF